MTNSVNPGPAHEAQLRETGFLQVPEPAVISSENYGGKPILANVFAPGTQAPDAALSVAVRLHLREKMGGFAARKSK